jgi:hypothetical protein
MLRLSPFLRQRWVCWFCLCELCTRNLWGQFSICWAWGVHPLLIFSLVVAFLEFSGAVFWTGVYHHLIVQLFKLFYFCRVYGITVLDYSYGGMVLYRSLASSAIETASSIRVCQHFVNKGTYFKLMVCDALHKRIFLWCVEFQGCSSFSCIIWFFFVSSALVSTPYMEVSPMSLGALADCGTIILSLLRFIHLITLHQPLWNKLLKGFIWVKDTVMLLCSFFPFQITLLFLFVNIS